MVTSLLSYLYYSPTYINILQIFAFSRIDDLSWGTKGLDMTENDSIEREWEKRKYIFILQFVSTNAVLSYLFVKLAEFDYFKNILILTSTCLVAFLLIFRLVFALFYMIKYYCSRPWKTFSSTYIN
jgi:chitin synthase